MASTSQAFKRDESELLEDDVVSLTSSDPGASALLGSTQEEQEMSEGEEAEAEPSQTSCPAYEELLEVMDLATLMTDDARVICCQLAFTTTRRMSHCLKLPDRHAESLS
ncbi:hypothetical protein QQF64_027121 [Cirrhinus molitorella]|uniref:Uncharacterized protein n=1 Tax=Cirrhinus molitorella TaxID=172907 RepID=A0ABR3NBJ1_9TELE